MNIHIITQNEPFYIPKMINYILTNKGSDINVVGFTVLKPHRENKNMCHWFMVRAKIYSRIELFYVFVAMAFVKIFYFISIRFSASKIMSKYNIGFIPTNDINSKDYIDKLKSLDSKIDIIISISCPQIFDKELLLLPELACINVHGTLLPRHRGVFGSWWTLFSNDKKAGATIHTMEDKLDAGKILWQKEFDICKNDTQYSIAYKTKKMMAEGILNIINNFQERIDNPVISKYSSTYHRAPTKVQGKVFHKKGKHIIIIRNLKNMLASKF